MTVVLHPALHPLRRDGLQGLDQFVHVGRRALRPRGGERLAQPRRVAQGALQALAAAGLVEDARVALRIVRQIRTQFRQQVGKAAEGLVAIAEIVVTINLINGAAC
ncbi:MAG: hypothetical protein N3C63_07280 [Rhodocyclaceae bacterium]|nr:hypothetical protein [Rhodocyclaceae bacterium]